MTYTPVTGLEIRMNFYTNANCVLEDVIENYFYQYFSLVNPLIQGRKESIAGRPTDGIIRFYNEDRKLLGWVLQETKRDIGLQSVFVARSFLQSVMYLGNIFYDTNILGVDNFVGIFLDSARYFCFVPKSVMVEVMEDFEPLWNKYYRVAPSQAYKEYELEMWAKITWHKIEKYYYELNNSFRLDEILQTIYEKYLNYGINDGTDVAGKSNKN